MTARVVKQPVPLINPKTGKPFPVGYFLGLVRKHNWPPMFEPSDTWGSNEVAHSESATRGRQKQLDNGYTGSIQGMSKASDARLERDKWAEIAKGRV